MQLDSLEIVHVLVLQRQQLSRWLVIFIKA